MIHRRTFLQGMFSALAAPAIVPFASLMPVKPLDPYVFEWSAWHPVYPEAVEALLAQRLEDGASIFARQLVKMIFEDRNGPPGLARLLEQQT